MSGWRKFTATIKFEYPRYLLIQRRVRGSWVVIHMTKSKPIRFYLGRCFATRCQKLAAA